MRDSSLRSISLLNPSLRPRPLTEPIRTVCQQCTDNGMRRPAVHCDVLVVILMLLVAMHGHLMCLMLAAPLGQIESGRCCIHEAFPA